MIQVALDLKPLVTIVDLPVDGLLLVDKPGPASPTSLTQPEAAHRSSGTREYLLSSHDVVQRVRRWSGQRRIGHTGTLDPMASGLLVLCLGWATRLVEYYQGHDKEYTAQITLGVATDTYDAEGTVVEQSPVPALTVAAIERALDAFRGTVAQTPPAYSAVKLDGESAYRRARRGETFAMPQRTVTFHTLKVVDFVAPDVLTLHVRCSAGGYVRSLAHDLGRALGTCATLTALRRTAAGPFRVADAFSLAMIEREAAEGRLMRCLLAPGAGLDLPVVRATDDELARLGHGQPVRMSEDTAASPGNLPNPDQTGSLAQVHDPMGRLAGIIRRVPRDDAQNAWWQAEKWFTSYPYADLQ